MERVELSHVLSGFAYLSQDIYKEHHTSLPTPKIPYPKYESNEETQMYSQNGPSLPLDRELCLAHHISTLPPLSPLHRPRSLSPGLSPLDPAFNPLVPTRHARIPRPVCIPRRASVSHHSHQHPNAVCPVRPTHPQPVVPSRQHHDDRGVGDRAAPHACKARTAFRRLARCA